MKEKIEELIAQQRLRKDEVKIILEELSQIDDSKLSQKDRHQLICSKQVLEVEYNTRFSIICELEDIL
jgi:hypothetical protein